MIQLGLLGWPLTHSASPALHAACGQLAQVAVTYQLFPTPPAALSATLAQHRDAGLRGLNVTAPHKAAAAQWVDVLTPEALRLGAVNTITFSGDGTAEGHNTDLTGFDWALGEAPVRHALVLGAGGAARAVLAALSDRGIPTAVLARDVTRAQGVIDALEARSARAHPLSTLAAHLGHAELLVDALPPAAAPFEAVSLTALPGDARVMTLNYGPSARATLAAAAAAGRIGVDGLGMLAAQGVASFARWTGRSVSPAAVLARLRALRAD